MYGEELLYLIGDDNPDAVLLRWLRTCKWNINGAVHRIMETLEWQHRWGVRALIEKGESDLSSEEIKIGKSYFVGHDRVGRAISYVPVKNHVRGQFPSIVSEKLSVFLTVIGRKLVQAPAESGTIIFDLAGFGLKNMDYQYLKFFQNLIQYYYPDSVGQMLILNAPWIFSGCWAIIKPWIDPAMESKIHFIKNEADLVQYIDPSIFPGPHNSNHANFEYVSPTVEDEVMHAALRADVQGKADAEATYKRAFQHYLSITLRWARDEDGPNLLAERQIAAKQLTDTFEKLIPFISTRTHYHCTGVIDEPIFQATYDRLRT